MDFELEDHFCERENLQIMVPDFPLVYPQIPDIESLKIEDLGIYSIVRDEMENPAGGIEDFLKSHARLFDFIRIVDTGSNDKTRKYLEKAKSEFSNLEVLDHKWNGFSDARNFSLQNPKTKWALVLDADERLTPDEFKRLKQAFDPDFEVFRFSLANIFPDGTQLFNQGWLDRLFVARKAVFSKCVFESLSLEKDAKLACADAKILHFVPSWFGNDLKFKNYYSLFDAETGVFTDKSPCGVNGFTEWRKFNPERLNYYPFK